MNKAILLVAAFGVGVSLAAENNYKSSFSKVSSEVQDFLDEESLTETRTVPSKTYTVDVLGRKKSSNQVTFLGKAKVSPKRKMRVDVVNLDLPDYQEKTVSTKTEFNPETGKTRLWLNGEELSQAEFDKAISKINSEKPDFIPGYTDSLSADEINNLLNGNKNVYISKHKDPINQMAYTAIFNTSQISTHAFTNSAKGKGIGIHFTETGCPHPNFWTSKYQNVNGCEHGWQTHPTGVLQVLSKTAPEASLYGYDQGTWPTRANHSNLEISSHSWASPYSPTNEYIEVDAMMDNYVYTNGITAFVAAGNVSPDVPNNKYVSSPGKALNAITVGAINPTNDNYTSYSKWMNSEIGNEKPEVANYTDFEFNNTLTFPCGSQTCTYNGYFNGTSASTPYTAAMVADLMSHHPSSLKGHPELIKAILVSGGKRPIPNASTHDPNNQTVAAKDIPVYSSLAWNRTFRTWRGENNQVFNSNQKITFTEAGIKGAHYRIGIAWLTSGSYILANKDLVQNQGQKMPQDIDLKVYQNGKVIAQSLSSTNPFEVVDFTPKTNDNLTIEIHRYRNTPNRNTNISLPPEKVILGYSMWVDR